MDTIELDLTERSSSSTADDFTERVDLLRLDAYLRLEQSNVESGDSFLDPSLKCYSPMAMPVMDIWKMGVSMSERLVNMLMRVRLVGIYTRSV